MTIGFGAKKQSKRRIDILKRLKTESVA